MPRRRLLRLIIPAYPEFNIYTRIAKRTTALGPILVASSANKVPGWKVEVIDENNCSRRTWPPNAADGHIDHELLQKKRPADIVGIYGSMSSSMPRAYQLAKFYKSQGVITVTGGFHVAALPEEALANGFDLVAFDGGEKAIIEIMRAYDLLCEANGLKDNPEPHAGETFLDYAISSRFESAQSAGVGTIDLAKMLSNYWRTISDAAYKNGEAIERNPPAKLRACRLQPLADFGLLLYARMKVFPINWRRGCPFNCEFCAVKEKPDFVPAEEFLTRVAHLVNKFQARDFFIVDDHFGGNLNDPEEHTLALQTLKLLADYQKKIGRRLSFTIQIRINIAEDRELITAMKAAGIDTVCIGYESPITEELRDMRKGYSADDMVHWTKLWHKAGFFVHGMFIFAYPHKLEEKREPNETAKAELMAKSLRLKSFIKEAKIDTIQILLAVPLPGTELRDRLEKEGRLLPMERLGWEYYDGQFPLYDPLDGTTPEDLQAAGRWLMHDFYGFRNITHVFWNWIFHFPRIVFPSVVTLATFRVKWIKQAYINWRDKHHRNAWIRAGGWFVVKEWLRKFKESDFPERLKKAQMALRNSIKSVTQRKGEK